MTWRHLRRTKDQLGKCVKPKTENYRVNQMNAICPCITLQKLSEDELSPDENVNQKLDAEDHREYDQWFAVDRMDELDEMIIEQFTEEEMDSIKIVAIRQLCHISVRNYESI
ncbi:hypothetical protein BDV93DRAFT_510645 [Ceratobasidium sp. AG-I]|nr:hypothetical protein BDV93DRAFT_510645 [Ceratobasidium sp. AG-I]